MVDAGQIGYKYEHFFGHELTCQAHLTCLGVSLLTLMQGSCLCPFSPKCKPTRLPRACAGAVARHQEWGIRGDRLLINTS